LASNFKNEELIKIQGKSYPLVGARLRIAHECNKQISIETILQYYNSENVVVQALIRTEKGLFNGLGNASTKRDKVLANAIVELAETRAIARALRFAGYGVEYTGFEEVGGNTETSNDDNETNASKTQLNVIFSIAKSLNIDNQELRNIIIDLTGKNFTKDLSKREADIIIQSLKSSLSSVNKILK